MQRNRSFRLLDAMILVAATGIGLALILAVQNATYGQISFSEVDATTSEVLDSLRASDWETLVGVGTQVTLLIACLFLPLAAILLHRSPESAVEVGIGRSHHWRNHAVFIPF